MASTSEKGHAKIVLNFENLIIFVKGYNTRYNPMKQALQVPQLEALLLQANTSLSHVIAKKTAYNNSINERQRVFSGLKKLCTRLVNILHTTDADTRLIDDAKSYNRKMQGQRATPLVAVDEEMNVMLPNRNSVSQQSYMQQIQHLAGLVAILESEPSYMPNESDLQIVSLVAKKEAMVSKNQDVMTTHVDFSNARIARNEILYTSANNLCDIATEIKKYIKAIYGSDSPEFAQVKGLEFRKAF